MSSNCKVVQCLEWCTMLPSIDHPQESPVFFLQGNEWFFRLVYKKFSVWYCELYLELKNDHKELKPCNVSYQMGFKNEQTLSLAKGAFKTSKHYEVWCKSEKELHSELPADYMDGNWIKFLFYFDDAVEPLFQITKKTGKTSSKLQSPDSQFRLEKLSQDFSKMLHDGVGHDVEIKCDGQTWKVHKNVLSARSEVLQAMLNSDMVEGRTGVITFQDMDVSTVEQFLSYLYCGNLPEMTSEIAMRFYEIGDKYAVECLKKVCLIYFVNSLTPENACETLKVAVQHSDSSFKESVIEFIIENKVFLNDELWQDFRNCNPMIALEVYERFCKAECSK